MKFAVIAATLLFASAGLASAENMLDERHDASASAATSVEVTQSMTNDSMPADAGPTSKGPTLR